MDKPVIEVNLLNGTTIKSTLVEMTNPGGHGTVIIDFKNRNGVILPRFWEVKSSVPAVKLMGVQSRADVALINWEIGWATLLRGEIDLLIVGLADLVNSRDGESIKIKGTPFAYSVKGNPIKNNCRMERSHRHSRSKIS